MNCCTIYHASFKFYIKSDSENNAIHVYYIIMKNVVMVLCRFYVIGIISVNFTKNLTLPMRGLYLLGLPCHRNTQSPQSHRHGVQLGRTCTYSDPENLHCLQIQENLSLRLDCYIYIIMVQ